MKKFILFTGLVSLMMACGTPRETVTAPPQVEAPAAIAETAPEFAPEEVAVPYEGPDSLPRYQASSRREADLLHTRLDLRFNWAEEKVLGKATLTLRPYFYPASSVTLDAKGFEFHKVSLAGKNTPLSYTYNADQITIQLDRTYTRSESYDLELEYTAAPSASGGSDVITSNKGLFFINPKGEVPNKPMQIWTQGETSWNSRWFPTIDHPNERCTQELSMTVENRFKTLSNGILVKTTPNPDGTRTDYWKLDQPHAPYLFMVAVGEYAVVQDQWRNVPLQYYVEPEFEADAKAIFPYTPEMLEFFSTKLGVNYPWPKYAQIVVRDFVSGAMENTTAVTFGEFVQKHRLDLVDDRDNEKIVAHEMMHHWFGDLVTCESWANLTLNEGFANYSEYLWLEHKYGRNEADFHLLEEWDGYFNSTASDVHPLIHFGHEDKEDMFDAHSYNKGGSVLHMLRHYVGDDAFFTALKTFLDKHAYSSVEVQDLRLAFEAVTGEDLNWFFNQWYLAAGHPMLNLQYGYDAAAGKATLSVEQMQDATQMPGIFDLPTAVDIYVEGQPVRREKIRVNKREQTFSFDVPAEPALMVFDPEHTLLMEKQEEKSEVQYIYQYFNAPSLVDRVEALQFLTQSESDDILTVFNAGLSDKFWLIRAVAVSYADFEEAPVIQTIRQLAKTDPHSSVRREAIGKLGEWEDEEATLTARYILDRDSVPGVLAAGLAILAASDSKAALEYARKWENSTNDDLLGIITDIYSAEEDPASLPFFERQLDNVDGFMAMSVFGGYQSLLTKLDIDPAIAALEKISGIARNTSESVWRRFSAVKVLYDMSVAFEKSSAKGEDEALSGRYKSQAGVLRKQVEDLRDAETDEDLKGIYNQLLEGKAD